MMFESFRTKDRTDLVYTLDQLVGLEYPGDKHLTLFRSQWREILLNMNPDDIPKEFALKDMLSKSQSR